ncbi:DUF790 family protein [Chloroflexia bacterium SDU3-3]|nr:DUF790 family protein [Chloroflexia bacterium SDU3-3]
MAFTTSEFKKTTRRSDGARQIYPYQIRDERYTAAISYAIAYYERMVGKRRATFEADTLLEFFGDAKLARGLVACLGRSYVWRERSFADAFGPEAAQLLWAIGLRTPADLRARLYGLANGRYHGFLLPAQRPEALDLLCAQFAAEVAEARGAALGFTAAQLELGLTLDSEGERVLVRQGPAPTADEIVARYNYHSLETALCHTEQLRLRLRGPIWNIVRSAHNLARRYRVRYTVGAVRTLFDESVELVLHGQRDAMGSWLRTGRRVVRVLLRLLAAHPDSLADGEAAIHMGGQSLLLKIDRRVLDVLGVAARLEPDASEPWEEDAIELFRKAWGRAYVRGRTDGWRLRRDPEPLIGAGGVVVPDFALVRGGERLALCLTAGRAATEALARDLGQLGSRAQALAVVPGSAAERLRSSPAPLATYEQQPAEAIPSLVATLARRYPRDRAAELTPWQRLERQVAAEGFVGLEEVAALLGSPAADALESVRRWGGAGLHVLPGLGVCAPEDLGEIRQLIDAGELRQAA